jgi:DNA-binding NarL/FixJ family response regulator
MKSPPHKMPRERRILIVDDHPMMREGLTMRIKREPDITVCGEAGTAAEALRLVLSLKPDLAVVDITLPDKNGLDLIKDIRAVSPGTLILALSMHDETIYAERVLRAGGRGYIMKQEGGKRIMEAIRTVLDGRVFTSEAVSEKILDIFAGRCERLEDSPVSRLSDREFEVFQMIGQGRSTRQMAAALNLSVKTIEVHRLHIKEKLGMKTAPELVSFAARWLGD